MRVFYFLTILFLFYDLDGVNSVLLFQRPLFDCRRIPPSYCCSSRVRRSCPELCSSHSCMRRPPPPPPFTMPPPLTSLLGPLGLFGLPPLRPPLMPPRPPMPFMPFGSIGLPLPGRGGSIGGRPAPGPDVDVDGSEVGEVATQAPILTPPTFPTLIPQPRQITHDRPEGPQPPTPQPPLIFGTDTPPGLAIPWGGGGATTQGSIPPIEENIEGPGESVDVDALKHLPNGAIDGEIKGKNNRGKKKRKKSKALIPPVFPDSRPELIEFGEESEGEIVPGQSAVQPPPPNSPEPLSAQVSPPPVFLPPGIAPTEPTIIDQEELLRPEGPFGPQPPGIGPVQVPSAHIPSGSNPSPWSASSWKKDLPEPPPENQSGGLKFVIKPHENTKTEAGASSRTTQAVKEVAGQGLGSWKVAIAPSGYKSEQTETNLIPDSVNQSIVVAPNNRERLRPRVRNLNKHVDLRNRTELELAVNNEKFNRLINSLFSNHTKSEFTIPPPVVDVSRPMARPTPEEHGPFVSFSSIDPRSQVSHVFSSHAVTQVSIYETTVAKTCGQAPDFTPCLPYEKANALLLGCCQRKAMPAGCLELCRYDVTQKDIKKAFEAGKCGILNVAPFLECASGGKNNLECCRHRGIAQKSGPQCEVFCNPSAGFGVLGIQHLACQNVIGDLIQCHHSGLRE